MGLSDEIIRCKTSTNMVFPSILPLWDLIISQCTAHDLYPWNRAISRMVRCLPRRPSQGFGIRSKSRAIVLSLRHGFISAGQVSIEEPVLRRRIMNSSDCGGCSRASRQSITRGVVLVGGDEQARQTHSINVGRRDEKKGRRARPIEEQLCTYVLDFAADQDVWCWPGPDTLCTLRMK